MAEPLTTYHTRVIPRGIYGEASKIKEECEEFIDAVEQKCSIMALVELSDMYGAVRAYLAQNFNMTMADLEAMANITERAYHGRRY